MDNPNELGDKRIGYLLRKFSIPAITGMLVNSLYNVVDSIFVGNGVGAVGLAAVTVAFPIMIIMMGFGMLVGIGATTLVSIRIGEQRKSEAEKILGNAFVLAVVFSVALSAVLLLFLDPVLMLLGADEEVLPYARDFTRIILYGSVLVFTGFGLNNIIRAEGSPKTAMMTMIISAVLNIILNPILIFVLGLGIKGSALATIISQAVSAVWVISYFLGPRSFLKFHMANFKLDKEIVSGILAMGSSAFFMQVASSLVTSLLNFTLLAYGGSMAVAAMGVVSRVAMVLLMPIFGISQGVQPIVGYNFGAGNFDRVKKAVMLGIYYATAISVFGFVMIQLFDNEIIGIFNNDPTLIGIGSYGLKIFLAMLPVVGFQVIGTTYFQAIGKPTHALLLSLSRQVLTLMPLVLILPRFLGLEGIWLAGPLSDLASTLLTAILLLREVAKLKRLKLN